MDATQPSLRTWAAVLLALLCNGLGHAYAGRVLAGAVVHSLWLGATSAAVAALRIGFRAAIAQEWRCSYVFFSIGASGIRWDRVGKDVQ